MASTMMTRSVVGLKQSSFVAGRPVVSRVAVPRLARNFTVRAADRPLWYPGATPPSYLDGSLPGDYGFDPLRLGSNPESLKWFAEGERINGRWAMLAVLGILVQEATGAPSWWEAGAKADLPLSLPVLIAIEIAVFAVAEGARFKAYIDSNGDTTKINIDPAGMTSKETQIKEVKNGRLAMLAFLGFASVYFNRGMGPIAALKLHLEDPGRNNIFSSGVGNEFALAVIALAIVPIIIEAKNALGDGSEEEFDPIPW